MAALCAGSDWAGDVFHRKIRTIVLKVMSSATKLTPPETGPAQSGFEVSRRAAAGSHWKPAVFLLLLASIRLDIGQRVDMIGVVEFADFSSGLLDPTESLV